MGFFLRILFACMLGLALAEDDTCPPASAISPCTCDGEGMNCMAGVSGDQIKKAFKATFKYGGVRAIWIQGTTLKEVSADLFNSIKSQQFYIEMNNVTSVDMNAFKSSQDIVNTLSFFGNQLPSFRFADLRGYNNLRVLNFGKNQLRSIPDNAFTGNPNLMTLILGQNKISSIGVNAFSNLASLQRLDIAYNSLTTLGPQSLACNSRFQGFQINLSANQISGVSATAFQGTTPRVLYLTQNRLTSLSYNSFFDLVSRMAQISGQIELSQNQFTCKGCNDYNWVEQNKNLLSQMFVGFRCPDGTGVLQLTRYSIGC